MVLFINFFRLKNLHIWFLLRGVYKLHYPETLACTWLVRWRMTSCDATSRRAGLFSIWFRLYWGFKHFFCLLIYFSFTYWGFHSGCLCFQLRLLVLTPVWVTFYLNTSPLLLQRLFVLSPAKLTYGSRWIIFLFLHRLKLNYLRGGTDRDGRVVGAPGLWWREAAESVGAAALSGGPGWDAAVTHGGGMLHPKVLTNNSICSLY